MNWFGWLTGALWPRREHALACGGLKNKCPLDPQACKEYARFCKRHRERERFLKNIPPPVTQIHPPDYFKIKRTKK